VVTWLPVVAFTAVRVWTVPSAVYVNWVVRFVSSDAPHPVPLLERLVWLIAVELPVNFH